MGNAVAHYTRAADLGSVPSAAVASCEQATIFSNRAVARLKTREKDAAGALSDAENAISLDQQCVKAHYRRALALVTLERRAEAMDGLCAALNMFPNEAAFAQELAKLE